MRDRLIEMLQEARKKYNNLLFEKELIADHLLANGVIVPPCKVGDTVWFVHCGEIYPYEIKSFEISTLGNFAYSKYLGFAFEDFGKTVFLTKEEAEKALKEREGK